MLTSGFTSLLDNNDRDVFDSVIELGLRTWPPSGVHVTEDDGLVHLFYVLDGILSCQRSTHLTRVLPRELLRIGRSDERVLENPSRSDDALAIQISLLPTKPVDVTTRHHYFSDDLKDNQLCRVAACERNGRTLATGAPVDVYLTTLGRYDTLLLERQPHQPLLVLCVRGAASVNTQAVASGDPAVSIDGESATIVGSRPCTIVTLRGHRA